eukprot:Skav234979  [mRNA]  locus=scaffold122:148698:149978:+ [translate_table: standard]
MVALIAGTTNTSATMIMEAYPVDASLANGTRYAAWIGTRRRDFGTASHWYPRYDLIWVQWVLLYLTDADLRATLKRLQEALRPNGLLIIKENCLLNTSAGCLGAESGSDRHFEVYWGTEPGIVRVVIAQVIAQRIQMATSAAQIFTLPLVSRWVDHRDSSLCRSDAALQQIFAEVGLRLRSKELQREWPDTMLPVA